ncbi:MAG: hypothetical protein II841_02770, partial [Bacteroidales bacterium]|nr:hypothetical protein [Bacteroidales bacterium]
LAQLTGMRFIPVSCANMLIIDGLSATATVVRTSKQCWNAVFLYVHRKKCLPLAEGADVRTSPPHWIAGFLYVHRLGWGVAKKPTSTPMAQVQP